MLNEVKLFFENLTNFRQLLSEGVGESSIIDAIEKHKIVYIYYAGDETIMKGYRTIKPMVLGGSVSEKAQKEGPYMLLRAWEEAGNSDSQKKYADQKGRLKLGWRLFRVDKITSFLPTGKFFSTDEKNFPDIESYNPNDSQMTGIKAAVQVNAEVPRVTKRGANIQQKPADAQKFQYFSKAGVANRKPDPEEIKRLWFIADRVKKKSKDKLIVITDEHGDMLLKDAAQQSKFPPNSIVGNLRDLYNDAIKNEKVDNSFIVNKEKDLRKQLEQNKKLNKPNITQENREIKTFFK